MLDQLLYFAAGIAQACGILIEIIIQRLGARFRAPGHLQFSRHSWQLLRQFPSKQNKDRQTSCTCTRKYATYYFA